MGFKRKNDLLNHWSNYFLLVTLFHCCFSNAQKDSVTINSYPFLSKTFFEFNLGSLETPYTNDLLLEGFEAQKTQKNRFSGKLAIGYHYNENWAVKYGVSRQAIWFQYKNINDLKLNKSVFTNIWFLNAQYKTSLNNNLSIVAETGPAHVARKGFKIGNTQILEDKSYLSVMLGLGLQYRLNDALSLQLQSNYIPKSTNGQPHILQHTAGLSYNLTRLVPKTYHDSIKEKVFFPNKSVQIGYANNALGYAANKFFSLNSRIGNIEQIGIPIFWYGNVKAQHAVNINYSKTVYKSKKIFSLGYGASITLFKTTLEKDWVAAISVYPQMNFYFWRNNHFNAYGIYSVIGPTFLSKKNIDNIPTGPKATYQDFMGIGAYFGPDNRQNIELKITHYSNGNWFNENEGVAIPISFNYGYQF